MALNEVAPPGMEHVVKALKKKFPGDKARAFKIAWAMYNKKESAEGKKLRQILESNWTKLKNVDVRNTSGPLDRPQDYHVERKKVPINNIRNTQETVHSPTVRKYADSIKGGKWDEHKNPPKLIASGNQHHIIAGEGHHRVLAHSMAGKNHILADVYTKKE